MKRSFLVCLPTLTLLLAEPVQAGEPSMDSAPPVVVQTFPVAGATHVDPTATEIRVTFSKPIRDGDWSWTAWNECVLPEKAGEPRYLPDRRTCVLPVKLKPETLYAAWLNKGEAISFKDTNDVPAVPYLLTFVTGRMPETANTADLLLNSDQRLFLEWSDRQFHSLFDHRTFTGWADKERTEMETRLIDAIQGPVTREYYQAINTLAAMHSTHALPALRHIALDRRDKDNRDRWMAIRALGLIGDMSSIPDLIPLVYHGNVNTRWWAQVTLVRLTGKNFGKDWSAWGKWWNESGGHPAYKPEIIQWWKGQGADNNLAENLAESDDKFFRKL
jgi:hypothetical protein